MRRGEVLLREWEVERVMEHSKSEEKAGGSVREKGGSQQQRWGGGTEDDSRGEMVKEKYKDACIRACTIKVSLYANLKKSIKYRAGELAHQVKICADKPDDLSPVPRTPASCPLPSHMTSGMCAHTRTLSLSHTHTKIKVQNTMK